METVLIHPLAGMLSAYGIGLAPVKAIREVSLMRPLGESFAQELAALKALTAAPAIVPPVPRTRMRGLVMRLPYSSAPDSASPPARQHKAIAFAPRRVRERIHVVGRLAQLVEHLVYTERVGGSSPSAPTTIRTSRARGIE